MFIKRTHHWTRNNVKLYPRKLFTYATERWVGLPLLWHGQETKQIGPIEMPLNQVGWKSYPLPEGLKWANLSYADIDEIFNQLDDGKGATRNQLYWLMSHPLMKADFFLVLRCHLVINWCGEFTVFHAIGKLLSIIELDSMNTDQYYNSHNTVIKKMTRRVNFIGISQNIIFATFTIRPAIASPFVVQTNWEYHFSDSLCPPLIPYNSPRTAGLRRMTKEKH